MVALQQLGAACQLLVGATFLVAGATKALDSERFLHAILGYKLFGRRTAKSIATLLPSLEITLGASLLSGVGASIALVASIGLLALFLLSMVATLVRGISTACGCYSRRDENVGGRTIARTGLLLIFAVAPLTIGRAFDLWSGRALAPTDMTEYLIAASLAAAMVSLATVAGHWSHLHQLARAAFDANDPTMSGGTSA